MTTNPRMKQLSAIASQIDLFLLQDTHQDEPEVRQLLVSAIKRIDAATVMVSRRDVMAVTQGQPA